MARDNSEAGVLIMTREIVAGAEYQRNKVSTLLKDEAFITLSRPRIKATLRAGRATGATAANADSSKSQGVFAITVSEVERYTFVDLAGERRLRWAEG